MPGDFSTPLRLLKLGAGANLFFLADTVLRRPAGGDAEVVVPAVILFAVCGYRCLFPNRYEGNVVLHDTVLSSTLVTRVLATFAEVAWIALLSTVLRRLNVAGVAWIQALAWWMVVQVVISQAFVWRAIATGRYRDYVYEEAGWAILIAAHTLASAGLFLGADVSGGGRALLGWNVLFGAGYLPWQGFHLRALAAEARGQEQARGASDLGVAARLRRALLERNVTTDADSWGGVIGLTWMTAYWATLVPAWVYAVVRVAAA
jgi:hypothetical protein